MNKFLQGGCLCRVTKNKEGYTQQISTYQIIRQSNTVAATSTPPKVAINILSGPYPPLAPLVLVVVLVDKVKLTGGGAVDAFRDRLVPGAT